MLRPGHGREGRGRQPPDGVEEDPRIRRGAPGRRDLRGRPPREPRMEGDPGQPQEPDLRARPGRAVDWLGPRRSPRGRLNCGPGSPFGDRPAARCAGPDQGRDRLDAAFPRGGRDGHALRARRGPRPRRRRVCRARALFQGPALAEDRPEVQAGDSPALLLQLAARSMPRLPGVRQDHRDRLPPRDTRPVAFNRRRRDPVLGGRSTARRRTT